MPSVSASARTASAHRMACVGPSNVVRWPSPVLFTTVSPNRQINEISSSRLSLREMRRRHPAETSTTDANKPGINI